MPYNAFQLAEDMVAMGELIERNAWAKGKQASGDTVAKASQEAYLKLAVADELLHADERALDKFTGDLVDTIVKASKEAKGDTFTIQFNRKDTK